MSAPKMAGRELDALIAERFGAHVGWVGGEPFDTSNDGSIVGLVPRYSTDMTAAWLIVEKLEPKFRFLLERQHFGGGNDELEPEHWRACFGTNRNTEWAQTAPHAICLAALAALDAEISGRPTTPSSQETRKETR